VLADRRQYHPDVTRPVSIPCLLALRIVCYLTLLVALSVWLVTLAA
jgi:hypothetical protein